MRRRMTHFAEGQVEGRAEAGRQTRNQARNQAGVTLLELVIAVFVLAIGTIAAMRAVGHAERNIGSEAARVFAAEVALNRAEELRLWGARDGRSLPQSVEYGPYHWQISVDEKETRAGFIEATVTARAEGQPGGRYVVIVRKGGNQDDSQ